MKAKSPALDRLNVSLYATPICDILYLSSREIFIFIGCGNHGNVVFLILLIGYYLYALRHRIPDFNTSGEEWSLVREMSVYVELSKLVLILDIIVML